MITRIITIILIVVAAFVVIKFTTSEATSGPVATNIQMKIKALTTWDSKSIVKDPVGYMNYAISTAEDIIIELKAANLDFRTQKRATERKIASNADELAAAKKLLSEFRTAYTQGNETQSWPVTLRDQSYTEPELRDKITNFGRYFENHDKEKKRLQTLHTKLAGHESQMEAKLLNATAAKEEFKRQLQVIRVNNAITNLDSLESTVNELRDTADILEQMPEGSVKEEVGEAVRESTSGADFERYMSMPLE